MLKKSVLIVALVCITYSCGNNNQGTVGKMGTALICTPENVSPEALRHAGIDPSGHKAVLPNGRAITPVGNRINTGDFPIGIAVSADETRAYVTHNGDGSRALMVLDLTVLPQTKEPFLAPSTAILQTIALGSTFRGVTLTKDGKTLIVGGGSKAKLHFFDVLENGTLLVPWSSLELAGYISDVELMPDGKSVLAVSNTNSKIYVVDLESRTIVKTLETKGAYPYDIIVSSDSKTLWASNMAASTVTAVSMDDGDTVTIKVGKGPEVMAMSPDGKHLYVACSDADAVYVIDTLQKKVINVFDISHDPQSLKHGNVNGLSISEDGNTLFVTSAGHNRLDLVDSSSGKVKGSIPTGWYPTEVFVGTKGLYVLSSKGMGNPDPRKLKYIPGFVQMIPWWDDENLAEWTDMVIANNQRAGAFFSDNCKPENILVLSGPPKSPITNVVLIVKENKTYDMVLGDLTDHEGNPIGNGDPNLVVFGEKYTPNFHELSRTFTTFDNYYSNPEVSLQGHQWCTSAHCNDFMEKTYLDQLPIAGLDPAILPDEEIGSIFDLCFAYGVSFRNYGEFPSFGHKMLFDYKDFYDHKYPFWTQGVWDVDKAAEVIREWELGIFPSFIFIGLPNDHTYGDKAGFPTPQTMVADNDRALGMLIEWLSHSPYWPHTAVFVIEDDPQGTGDHVDAHRSILTVVSPWVRRGYLSSVHYDIPSVFRTIELILGLPPMGKNDAYAPPIVDIWADGDVVPPDYTPYVALPVDVPFEINLRASKASQIVPDDCGDDVDGCEGLAAAIWKIMRGDEPPPPYARGIDR